jgi:hypothetical protein
MITREFQYESCGPQFEFRQAFMEKLIRIGEKVLDGGVAMWPFEKEMPK